MDQDRTEPERQPCEASPEQPTLEHPPGASAPAGESWVVWALLLGLALLVRLPGLSEAGLWHDEVISIHVARMNLYDLLISMSLVDHHPPLYFVLLKIWALGSWSVIWLRLLSVLVSIFGVAFAVLWMRRIDDRAGWLTGLLVAVSPVVVHYGQEIRPYGLCYTAVLAGLYYSERLAARSTPHARLGWLIACTAATWTLYLGLLATPALAAYAWLRGAPRRSLVRITGIWLLTIAPVVIVAFLLARHRATDGFWGPPLSLARAGSLVGSWLALQTAGFGQHAALDTWQAAGDGPIRAWTAFGLRTLLLTGAALGLLLSVLSGWRATRSPARAMLAAAVIYTGLVVGVSLTVAPLALTRLTFVAALPLMGLLALASARAGRRRLSGLGLGCCILVACVWMVVDQLVPPGASGRRPNEPAAFGPIAARFGPHDTLAVFSPELQASAGYFLADRAMSEQIFTTEFPRLIDTPAGLRLRPVRRQPDPAWFSRFTRAVEQNAAADHAVWLLDLGPRSVGDEQRRRLLQWLKEEYVREASYRLDGRWTFAVQRFVPAAAGRAE